MAELAISSNFFNVIARSDNIVVSPIVANGVASLSMSVGTNALAAFTGSAAFEKFTIIFKAPQNMELLVNLGAITASIALYKSVGGALLSQTTPSLGFQSLGTIQANTVYLLSVTSSVLIAANAFIFSMSARVSYTFNSYFQANQPKTITGMETVVNQLTGVPSYVFNNATFTTNAVGRIEIDTYYSALASGQIQFTTTSNSFGNSLASVFPTASFSNQNFTSGDNISIVMTGMPNMTYTGISGTLNIIMPNVGVPTYVYITNSSYVGPLDTITPYTIQYMSAKRLPKSSICEMEEDVEATNTKLAIKDKEEISILQ